jgi:threonine dehydrogenase-like Zn-dependent dehydrogenase
MGVTTGTMASAVITGAGQIEVRETPVPQPGEGQVRVKLEGCGVCASNLGPWSGPTWMKFPTEPGGLGHEGWGIVDSLGHGTDPALLGRRVSALSFHSYAEYDVADAAAVVPLPPALDGQPFPGEPLGCAVNIFNRSDIGAGQTVAIVGIGFLGALLTQLATDAGARVIAISRRPYSLQVAREMGAAVTIAMDDPQSVIEEVKGLTEDGLCPRVIEAVGKQQPLDLAAELTAERGRLIIAGYHQDGPRQVDMQMWNWRGFDVVNAHERDQRQYVAGIREAVDLVVSGRMRPQPLFTHSYPLERLDEALNDTRDRPDGFMKALIRL